jgi:hypothetical protein
LLLADGTDRHGSLLTLRDEVHAPGAIMVHERCYEDFQRGRRQGRAEAAG